MEFERIESLAKEKELFLKDSYVEKGISSSLLDVKFSVDPTEGADKQFSKLKSAIKRAKKDTFLASSFEEKLQFLQNISFGPYTIQVEPLTWDIDAFSQERTLLHSLVEEKKVVSVYSSDYSDMPLSYICETSSDQLSFNF